LRNIAVFSVIVVHSVHVSMYAVDIYNWDLRETVPDIVEQIEKGRGILKSYLSFGIPIFFYVSGCSAAHFDETKGFGKYFKSRF